MRSHFQLDSSAEAFDLHLERLLDAAITLLGCDSCAELVLQSAREEFGVRQVFAGFEYTSSMRIVVRLAIAQLQRRVRGGFGDGLCGDRNCAQRAKSALRDLPWQERCVFFLREVLRYSKRDTALLVELADKQVEQLLATANRRICTLQGTPISWMPCWFQDEVSDVYAIKGAGIHAA